MRRLLAPVLALAMAAVLAPAAHAANGVLEIVSNGRAMGTLRLSSAARLAGKPTLLTPNPFLVLAATQKGKTSLSLAKPPVWRYFEWVPFGGEELPAGTSTVRVLTEGPVKLRLPVTGFSGKRTLRLDRRLSGGSVDIREIAPTGPANGVEDRIPFSAPVRSVLVHGAYRPEGIRAFSSASTCTTDRGSACAQLRPAFADIGPYEWSVIHHDWGRWNVQGDAHHESFEVGYGPPRVVTHYVFVLPTA